MSIRRKLLHGGAGVAPSVQQIPRSLMFGLLDSEMAHTITAPGNAVEAWGDTITGQSFVQATTARKPTYGATSFNGRPGITFDGVNHSLRNASTQMWPLSGAFEVWMLVDILRRAAGTEIILEYPASTSMQRFRVALSADGAISMQVGDGASNIAVGVTPSEQTGKHILRGVCTGTQTWFEVDGAQSPPKDAVPSLDAALTRNTIGGTAAGTAASFANFNTSCMLVTRRLPDQFAALVYADFNARRGGA